MYFYNKDNFWRDDLDSRPVMVSVRCMTYNQEKYIAEALDGFLKQQTDFRFEVIVHDDASTDSTAEILKEYAGKYPSIIKPVLEEVNTYHKEEFHTVEKMDALMRGKYVAMCEGDDYWTDPLKLQKQVDFLESHPDYQMCFNGVIKHYEDGSHPDHLLAEVESREYTLQELADSYICQTASLIFRRSFYDTELYKSCPPEWVVDLFLIYGNAKIGKVFCFKEPMSVYRINSKSVTHDVNRIRRFDENVLERLWGIGVLVGLNTNKKRHHAYYYQNRVYSAIKNHYWGLAAEGMWRSFKISPKWTFIAFVGVRWNVKNLVNKLLKFLRHD